MWRELSCVRPWCAYSWMPAKKGGKKDWRGPESTCRSRQEWNNYGHQLWPITLQTSSQSNSHGKSERQKCGALCQPNNLKSLCAGWASCGQQSTQAADICTILRVQTPKAPMLSWKFWLCNVLTLAEAWRYFQNRSPTYREYLPFCLTFSWHYIDISIHYV